LSTLIHKYNVTVFWYFMQLKYSKATNTYTIYKAIATLSKLFSCNSSFLYQLIYLPTSGHLDFPRPDLNSTGPNERKEDLCSLKRKETYIHNKIIDPQPL